MTASELDFKLLFEASPEVLLVLLPDAPRFTMVGATRARLLATHTTAEQVIGYGLFELFPDNPDDPSAQGTSNLRASLNRVLATRAPDTMAVQKYDIREPSGAFTSKYWSPKNIPVLSASGEVLYILHRVEDVTDLVNAGKADKKLRGRTGEMEREVVARSRELSVAIRDLRAANIKLGELDAAKTAFFSNVSHEFRTPLTLMLGPIEDALGDEKEPLSVQQTARIKMAYDNTLRLFKLVNALLDFSRLEAGRLRATFAPLDVARFTAELAGMFQSALERAGLKLNVDCPILSTHAWVDREMWEKIVPNLISNALKFTLAGEISVRMREDSERIILEVADTGVGIPESELPKVFERFHRVVGAQARTHEGAGIGLSLVRELVLLHGGDVSVQSVVDHGSTFRVEIPKGYAHLPADSVSHKPVDPRIGRDAAAHAAEAARWNLGSITPGDTITAATLKTENIAREHVLVVDDNIDLREYIATLLAANYDVSTATDGIAALEAMQVRMPDLIVSDVMMPRLDGFGLVREVRSDPSTASLPIILLSARAGEEAAIDGLDAGSDDYLIKPFSARELLARVRTHLQLARLRRAWISELEQANSELDAFSYSVSHDLRAPLRAIEGFSRALVDDCATFLNARAQTHIDKIRDGTKRMSTLIDALLGLAHMARGPIKSDRVDLAILALNVVTDLQRANPQRRVSVDIERPLLTNGDPQLLNVVLVNLIGNAWKFTSHNQDAHIEVGHTDDDQPTFFVRDNGAGFDMAYASKLFAPFQRLHTTDEFEGTGVGLATVQRAIARHNGKIWAESQLGQGATFYFSLPGNRVPTNGLSQ